MGNHVLRHTLPWGNHVLTHAALRQPCPHTRCLEATMSSHTRCLEATMSSHTRCLEATMLTHAALRQPCPRTHAALRQTLDTEAEDIYGRCHCHFKTKINIIFFYKNSVVVLILRHLSVVLSWPCQTVIIFCGHQLLLLLFKQCCFDCRKQLVRSFGQQLWGVMSVSKRQPDYMSMCLWTS